MSLKLNACIHKGMGNGRIVNGSVLSAAISKTQTKES